MESFIEALNAPCTCTEEQHCDRCIEISRKFFKIEIGKHRSKELKEECPSCGRMVAIGSPITRDCDDCLRVVVGLRKTQTMAGWDSSLCPLTKEYRERCFAIGIEPW